MFIWLLFMLWVNYAYNWSWDYWIIYATLALAIKFWICYPLLKAKCSQTSVSLLSLMNPWLYLLSMICAHSCNFSTPQVMLMMLVGMRTTVMCTRLEVNQSTVSLCGTSIESVVYSYYHFCIRLYDLLSFRYVINTAMVHLRFVYLCVWLFLGHIWVFYASYFILGDWLHGAISTVKQVWVYPSGSRLCLLVGRSHALQECWQYAFKEDVQRNNISKIWSSKDSDKW